MARLRKAARIWGNPKSRAIGERVLFTPDDHLFMIDPPAMFGRRAPIEVEIGATAYVATEVRDYSAEIFPMMLAAGFLRAVEAAPGAERTGFARKYVAAGKPVYSAAFRKPRESKSN